VALSEDLSHLFGDEDAGIQALEEMRAKVKAEMETRLADPNHVPEPNPLLKGDGVNLTPEGEEKLAEIAGEGALTQDARMQENAEILFAQTEVEAESIDEKIAEASEDTPSEGEIITGEVAADVGRRVEEAGMGHLREDEKGEDDKDAD
jgi:hypothetical protein